MEHRFQVDLRGVVDLLSNHLYRSPDVFVRELLQNAADAVTARAKVEPSYVGRIRFEAVAQGPTLVVEDDGIGLTEDEVHRFVATVGRSSKFDLDRPGEESDFIGRFGIGLLSAFLVADEIVLVTRSTQPGAVPLEWRGRPDGTYSLRSLERDLAPGTAVHLRAKLGYADYFAPARVAERVRYYGAYLPVQIVLSAGGRETRLDADVAPWAAPDRGSMLAAGRELFGGEFLDAVPLASRAGCVRGVAYVLPYSPGLAARPAHRVYAKGMLVSERVENLLPEWAFFVRAVVDAGALRPTAARDALYEDEILAAARRSLGQCLRAYLLEIARAGDGRLERLISLHYRSIKALACEDDELYRIFIDWLPFETSSGEMPFGRYREGRSVVRYARTCDEFRQVAPVVSAQGGCVVNGGYSFDTDLLEKAGRIFPGLAVERIRASDVSADFAAVEGPEARRAAAFREVLASVLAPLGCDVEVKRFQPKELAALHLRSAEAEFLDAARRAGEVAGEAWSSILDAVARRSDSPPARIVFNYDHPVVRRLADLPRTRVFERSVEMLFVQALLEGHHPLGAREIRLLNTGLAELIEIGSRAAEMEGSQP